MGNEEQEIPGEHDYEWRRFLYLESRGRDFRRLFDELGDFIDRGSSAPKSGGMISESTRIETPSDGVFEGVSFKGDFDGWDAGIRAFGAAHGLRVAKAMPGALVVGERQIPFAKCRIIRRSLASRPSPKEAVSEEKVVRRPVPPVWES